MQIILHLFGFFVNHSNISFYRLSHNFCQFSTQCFRHNFRYRICHGKNNTIFIHGWSSWNTRISKLAFNRSSISKQRGALIFSRLILPIIFRYPHSWKELWQTDHLHYSLPILCSASRNLLPSQPDPDSTFQKFLCIIEIPL